MVNSDELVHGPDAGLLHPSPCQARGRLAAYANQVCLIHHVLRALPATFLRGRLKIVNRATLCESNIYKYNNSYLSAQGRF